eukprot:611781-Pyramimonas_sp.AAC.1
MHELRGLRAGRFQNVALALAPRTVLSKHCNRFTDFNGQRTRDGVWKIHMIMRVNSYVDSRCCKPTSGVLARSKIAITQQSR